ncbi:C1QL [Mytilus coruscus]|uniref:C1QL n=1 Tax=Mytilus coruscus TaxID=42192 RepID=A0A6J8E1Q2_MYTCO|nr:C1QL [Mytilus coruscus]
MYLSFILVTWISGTVCGSTIETTMLLEIIERQNTMMTSMELRMNKQSLEIGSLKSEVESLQDKIESHESLLRKFEANTVDGGKDFTGKLRPRFLMEERQDAVAFYAYLSKTENDPGHRHIIAFDQVPVGNAYISHNGEFVAPSAGIYVFSVSIACDWEGRIPIEIVVNSNVVGSTVSDSKPARHVAVASETVIVSMEQNDRCFIRTTPDAHREIILNVYSSSYARSSFAGWKISN